MLLLFSGDFESLESAFFRRVKELKTDPWKPLAVVAPSTRLLDRLQLILAQNAGSFLNIHFHTFSSLAQEIVLATRPLEKAVLSDPLFFDLLVKQILREKKPFHGLADLAVPEGFPPAVRATLRDLMDAGVEARNVEAAMEEEFLGRKVDLGTLRELLTLYRLYLQRIETLPFFPKSTVVKEATRLAPDSPVLKSFSEIIYYGFYDLTGLQSDFFLSVTRAHPCSFFFPYIADKPSYSFAKRFRDNVLHQVQHEENVLPEVKKNPVSRVINVSGDFDESFVVAKEILALHESGMDYSDIAVIARSRERIADQIPRTLAEWGIPCQPSPRALGELPMTVAVMSLLTSSASSRSSSLKELQPWANQSLEQLAASLDGWPEEDGWTKWSRRVEEVLHLIFPEARRSEAVIALMFQSLASFDYFERLSPAVSRQEFFDALRDRWMKMSLPSETSPSGVSLLYAEAARGLRFKAIFLIGVEERVFPRIVREDPFLRDDARLALRDTVGYKIGQKLTALEEERLLFDLLINSADEKLYILYQRSDNDGKVVGPSTFLRAWAADRGSNLEELVESVPRPYFQKIEHAPPTRLGKREIVTRYLNAAADDDALAWTKKVGFDEAILEQGLRAQKILNEFGEPTAYDGLVGETPTGVVFPTVSISPSALETYGRCPFQYFGRSMLGLRPLERETSAEEWPADEKGKSVHLFMQKFFGTMFVDGKKWPDEFPSDLFARTFLETFPEINVSGVHPLLWSILRERMRIDLQRYLETEFEAARTNGFVPYYFEQEISTVLPAPLDKYKWLGKIDRIDVRGNEARIIDYKTGQLFKGSVASAAVAGLKAQGPLYILLAEDFLRRQGAGIEKLSFSYHRIAEELDVLELPDDEWQEHKAEILDTVKLQVDSMHAGIFPLVNDPKVCGYCDIEQICRRNHSISASRARRGPGEKILLIRKKKIGRKPIRKKKETARD